MQRLMPVFRRQFCSLSRLGNQARPLSGYYQLLLETPFIPATALPPPSPTPPPARIIFGSRLAGPTDRATDRSRKGKTVAGIWIPLKPVEPDNCCMSGCVNCTWDVFRQDLEEYRAAMIAAQKRLGDAGESLVDDGAVTDGGGLWEGFEDIPVGIKAFMETEKRLKEKHKAVGVGVG